MGFKHLPVALVALSCTALATATTNGKVAGNPQAGQAKAAACAGCHGADGNSAPEIYAALKAPKIAGQVPEYIAKSLHDFKAGRRVNESMSPQAQAVAEADIADIAAWFASQKVASAAATNKDVLAQGEKLFQKGSEIHTCGWPPSPWMMALRMPI